MNVQKALQQLISRQGCVLLVEVKAPDGARYRAEVVSIHTISTPPLEPGDPWGDECVLLAGVMSTRAGNS